MVLSLSPHLNVTSQNEEEVKKILVEEMENAVKLSVPLTVSVSVAKTWYEAK